MTKRRLLIVLPLFLLVGAIGAWAYWTTTGSGFANAGVGTLSAPTNVTASATAGSSTVSVSWTASAPADGLLPEGYDLLRWDGSTSSPACGSSSSSLITGTSCDDLSVADGTYTYTVVAVYRTWTAASAASNQVTVSGDVTAPTSSVTGHSPAANGNGWNKANVTVTISAADNTGGSGVKQIVYSTTADATYGGQTTGTTTVSGASANLLISTEGITTIHFHAEDNTGNVESPDHTYLVKLDKNGPSVQAVEASTFTLAPTVGFFTSGGQYVVFASVTDGLSGVSGGPTANVSAITASGTSVSLSPCLSLCTDSNGMSWAYKSAPLTADSRSELTNPYSFTVSGSDAAGNGTSQNGTANVDNTPPSGGSISYTDGYYTSLSVALSLSDGSDGGSGLFAAMDSLQRASSALSSNVCTGFGSFGSITKTTNDTSVASGNCYRYHYQVFDNVGNAVTYTPSPASTAKLDTSAPTTPGLSVASSGAFTYAIGTAVFYNPQAANSGSFTVTASTSDPESAIRKVNFPTLTGMSGGGDDPSSPYEATYSWTASSSASGAQTVTAYDNADLTASAQFTLSPDTSAPTGGSISASSDNGSYSTGGVISLTKTDYGDSGSGIASNVITRASASLSNNACGAFSGSTTVTISSGHDSQTLTTGCYRYTLTGTDNVGNQATSTSTIVKVDTTAPSNPLSITGTANPKQFVDNTNKVVYYNPQGSNSGSFTVTSSAADADSGIQKATFPNVFSGSDGGTISSSPYQGTYSWTAASSASGSKTVTAFNNAGAPTNTGFTVTPDTIAPSGGSVAASGLDGTGGVYSTSTTLSISFSKGSDNVGGSGVAATGAKLMRASAPLNSSSGTSDGTCGTYSAFSQVGSTDPTSPFADNAAGGIVSGNCYKYQYLVPDNVGNVATYASGDIKVDTSVPSTSVSLSSATGNTFLSGLTVYINAQAGRSGGFTASATSTDSDSGILKVNFPSLSGFSGGGDVTASPYSTAYTWSGAVAASGSQTVTASNNANLTNTGSFTVTPDTAVPTGGALTVNGTAATGAGSSSYNNTGSFTIGLRTDYTDSGSGLASSTLTRRGPALLSSGGIADGTCANFTGAQTQLTGTPNQSGLTTGCYLYTLTGADNVGNTVSISTIVKVDTSGPSVPAVTLSNAAGNTFVSGTTAYINPQSGRSGSFDVGATATDTDSGIFKLNFPGLSGFTSGGGDDTSSPYSTSYSWSGSVAASGSQTVTAYNDALGFNTGSFTVTPDTTAPTGGAVTVNSVAATPSGSSSTTSSTGFAINSRANYSETQSATQSGLASSILAVQSGTLLNSICGAAGSGGPYASPATISGTTNPAITAGFCYLYTLTGTDNVGNSASVSTTVKVLTSPSVTSLNPTSAGRNTTLTVKVFGSGFVSGAAVSFSGPKTITINSTTFVSSGEIDVSVSTPTGAGAVGSYSVTVTNPDGGTGTLTNGFSVT
jgi:hypothetical protein